MSVSANIPALGNKITKDVPDQNALNQRMMRCDFSDVTDLPVGTKALVESADGWEVRQYNGTGWVLLEKWNIDAQKVDGHSTSTGTTANTIPVRDAQGKLPGDITGNAATASEAAALSATNPIATGGTGATTAEQARDNLGVAPKSHASSSTEFGAGSSTQYGHLKSLDAPDATKTAATGHAFSPAGAKAELDKKLDKSGGRLTGALYFGGIGNMDYSDNDDYHAVWINRDTGNAIGIFATDSPIAPGEILLRANNGSKSSDLWLHPDGTADLKGNKILTSAGGTLTGALYKDSGGVLFASLRDNALHALNGGTASQKGSRIIMSGKDTEGWNGELQLEAHDGTNINVLRILPSGVAYLHNERVLTVAGGNLTGALYKNSGNFFVGLRDDAYYGIYGCTDYGKGSRIIMSGKDCEGWNGEMQLQACDGTNYNTLRLLPDGGISVSKGTLPAIVQKGTTSTSWYRKYSDGLIIQGGRVTGDTGSITFDIPFTSEDFAFVPGRSSEDENTGGFSLIAIPYGTSGVTLKYRNSSITSLKTGSWVKFSWIAIGY